MNIFRNLHRKEDLRRNLKNIKEKLHEHQTKIDSIDQELDLIREGKLHATDEQIGTLLQRKLLIQQNIVYEVEHMVYIERELKEL